jgi:hypothetical protein
MHRHRLRFFGIGAEISGLTPYAVEGRYPTDIPLEPTKEEGQTFLKQAAAVFAFVEKKIGDETPS